MSGAPELFILRHGETEWNRAGRMQGGLDSPLTARGAAQAEAQGRILRAFGIGGIGWISSPQGRARQTAEIARGAGVETDDRLREIGMGDWAGLLREEIAASVPDLFAPDAAPLAWYGHAPGGETLDAVAARVAAFLATLDGPRVVVTHGITSRMLRCAALGLPPEMFRHLEGGQGVVYRIGPSIYERLEDGGAVPQQLPRSGPLAPTRRDR